MWFGALNAPHPMATARDAFWSRSTASPGTLAAIDAGNFPTYSCRREFSGSRAEMHHDLRSAPAHTAIEPKRLGNIAFAGMLASITAMVAAGLLVRLNSFPGLHG